MGVPQNTLSLDEVFEQTVDRVYGFLMFRCGNEGIAEDLVAETYLAASSKFADGRGEEITTSWLLTVARRRLIDYWRADSTRRRGLSLLMNNIRTARASVQEPQRVAEAVCETEKRSYWRRCRNGIELL